MSKYFVGIDEAGRGSLAGPIFFALIGIKKDQYLSLLEEIKNKDYQLFDSKKLTPQQRLYWYQFIFKLKKSGQLICRETFFKAKTIDQQGLAWVNQRGIRRLLVNSKLAPNKLNILLDGGLKAPPNYLYQKTIIKGDEKEPLISLASIVAKVSRDAKLIRLANKIPGYGFQSHKGYGTKQHYQQIKRLGLSVEHRRSFIK